MRIKSKDLAALVGVSEATISLVINGKAGISDKTRKRVARKIIELGYSDLLKLQPVEGERKLGFVIYKDSGKLLGDNSFFPLILNGIEQTARRHGYSLTIINIDKQRLEHDIDHIREAKCSGFIIFATELHEEELPYFLSIGIPFIIFDNYFNNVNITSVKVNNEQGTFLAVQYLYKKGHQKIGYLSSGLDITSFNERQVCAIDAMRHFGILSREECVFTIGYPHEEAEEGMARLLDIYDKSILPTAFLTDNDLVAVGAMMAMKKAGYKLPSDFSIIGFDDRPICTMVEPKLTSLQLPRTRFGSEAVVQLVRIIEDNDGDSLITVGINGVLIERDSVRAIQT